MVKEERETMFMINESQRITTKQKS